MAAILTTGTRLFNAAQIKSAFDNTSLTKQYLFIGKSSPWDNEIAPDTPVDSAKTNIETRRDMISLKRITEADVSLGIIRRDWTSGQFYDFYRSDYGNVGVTGVNVIDGTATNPTSLLDANFFVVTDDYNVYQCVWNNGGVASTIKPTGSSTAKFQTADGYVWQYMYTISPSDVLKFLTTNFIPVKFLTASPGTTDPYYSQWQVQSSAVAGALSRILVTSGGAGYPISTSFPITVTGNGSGAIAVANTNSSGQITSITLSNAGNGYNWATATASGGSTPATLVVITSPDGGFGANPVNQLNGHYTIISNRLAYDEGAGDFPQTNEYRRIGILKSPKNYGSSTLSTASTLDATRTITLTIGVSGIFAQDEIISGGTSGATATVVSFDSVNRKIRVVQFGSNIGTFIVGELITGATSSATGVVSALTNPEVDVYSGDTIYLEHRRPIIRQADQIEDIKIIIES